MISPKGLIGGLKSSEEGIHKLKALTEASSRMQHKWVTTEELRYGGCILTFRLLRAILERKQRQ